MSAMCAALALTCALAALARPQARVMVAREPASIVLAVDMSNSMAADDVGPTRLAARGGCHPQVRFDLPKRDRVALVTFSSTVSVAAPLTRDRQMVLDALSFAGAPGQGTAIGDAIARGVELLAPGPADGGAALADGSGGGRLTADGDPSALGWRSDRGRLSRSRAPRGRAGGTSPSTRSRSARRGARSPPV